MNELVQFISEVGFPIFVAAFVLIRLEDKLDIHRKTPRTN